MKKKRKQTKLPNGYGACYKLSGNRRRPYVVFAPAVKGEQGKRVRQKPIAYCESYLEGIGVLTQYHKGVQLPGVELLPKPGKTFSEVFAMFYSEKFERSGKQLSDSSKRAAKTAFKNLTHLHSKTFSELTYDDLQNSLDSCPLKHSSLELILTLLRQMYQYALKTELVGKNPAQYLEIRKPDDDEHGVSLTEDEIALVWHDYYQNGTETAKKVLVMIYSGFRISAYLGLVVNLEQMYFMGGMKTKAGKGRVVPVYSAIQPIVKELLSENNGTLGIEEQRIFNADMRAYFSSIGITRYFTAHDLRHTFSMLCERYGVPEADHKRLMGHSFGNDLTRGTYGHRDLEDLRESIERIKVPGC